MGSGGGDRAIGGRASGGFGRAGMGGGARKSRPSRPRRTARPCRFALQAAPAHDLWGERRSGAEGHRQERDARAVGRAGGGAVALACCRVCVLV